MRDRRFPKELFVIIKSQKDFYSGLMFLAVGLAFAVGSQNYSIGEGAKMGPGYFPLVLGILLSILGTVIAGKSLLKSEHPGGDKIGKWAWKPLIFIIAANVLFGLMLGGLPSIGLPSMGLVAGIFALTILASLAGDAFNWKEVTVLAAVLSLGSYFAFVFLLKLPFQIWPAFLTH